MNIKLSEMLFEENNPTKLSKIFENTGDVDASDPEEQINLTKIELDKLSKRLAPMINKNLPDEEKMKDVDAEQVARALAPIIEKKKVGGIFELQVFDIKGQTAADMVRFSDLGFFLVELVKSKDGKVVSGENSQGNNLREFFLLPFPGYQTSDENKIAFHTELFGLKKPEEEVEGRVLKHLGVGAQIRVLAVEEKNPGEEGKDSQEIEAFRTALMSKNASKILYYVRKSTTGTAKSTVSGESSNDDQDQSDESTSEEQEKVTAGVAEGKFYKEKLSNLLFEKKSLGQLKSSKKKELVEYYLDVDYSSLNNYKKRDALLLAELLFKLDNNLLVEKMSKAERAAQSAAKAIARGEDDYGMPLDLDEEEKVSFLNKIKGFAGRVKDSAVSKKLQDFFKVQSFELSDKQKKAVGDAASGAGKKERGEIDVASEFSNTVLVNPSEEDKGADEETESAGDEDNEVDADEDLESDQLQVSDDEGLQAVVNKLKGDEYGKLILSKDGLNKKIDVTIKEAREVIGAIKEVSFNKPDGVEISDEDLAAAQESVDALNEANKKFKQTVSAHIEALEEIKNDTFDNYISKLTLSNLEGPDEDSKKQALFLLHQEKRVKQTVVIASNLELQIKSYKILNEPSDDLKQISANINSAGSKEDDVKKASEETLDVSKLITALVGTPLSQGSIENMFGGKFDTKLEKDNLQAGYVINKNLLNTKLIKEDRDVLSIKGKIIRDANGNIEPTAFKALAERLGQSSEYKSLRDKFVKNFIRDVGKKVENASDSELSDYMITYIQDLYSRLPASAGATSSKPSSRFWSTDVSAKGLGQALYNLTLRPIFGLLKGLWFTLKWAVYGTIGYSVYMLFTDPTTLATQAVKAATWLAGLARDVGYEMTVGGKIGVIFKAIGGALGDFGTWAGDALKTIWGKCTTLWADITTWFTSGSGATAWAWFKAPWAALIAGEWIAAFPFSTWVISNSAAAIAKLYASIYAWATGSTYAAAAAPLKTIAVNLGWVTTTKVAAAGSAAGAAAGTATVTGYGTAFKMLSSLEITLLLAGLAYMWWKRRKKKAAKLDERLGNILKYSILSVATGASVKEVMRLLGDDPAEYQATLMKNIIPTENEVKIVFDTIEKSKRKYDFENIRNLSELQRVVKNLEKLITALGSNKDIKATTIKYLSEVKESLERDVLLGQSKSLSDADIDTYYGQGMIHRIIYSKLQGNQNFITISDSNVIPLIQSKEDLVTSLQQKRNQHLSSLRKMGNISLKDDPINQLVARITSEKKESKLDYTLNISHVAKIVAKNVEDSSINVDSLIKQFSDNFINIVANYKQEYEKSGMPFNWDIFGKQKKYVEKFEKDISDNLAKSIEMLVDRSVITESADRSKNLLFEIKNKNLINYKTAKLLNEWSIAGIFNSAPGAITKATVGTALGGTAGIGIGAAALSAIGGAGTASSLVIGGATAIATLLTAWPYIVAALGIATIGYAIKSIWGSLKAVYDPALKNLEDIDPTQDSSYVKALTPLIQGIVKTKVAVSYVTTILQHKKALEALGIKISGEDSPMFAEIKKQADSMIQVADLKKNMSSEGQALITMFEDAVYKVKNANSPGLGDFMTSASISNFVEKICLQKDSPLEDIFKTLQDKGPEITSDGLIYKKGISILLEEEGARSKKNVKVSLNKAYSSLTKNIYSYFYRELSFNDSVEARIIDIVEPQTNANLKKMFTKKQGKEKEEFFYKTVLGAMELVTGIGQEQLKQMIFDEKARTKGQQKQNLQANFNRNLANLSVLKEADILQGAQITAYKGQPAYKIFYATDSTVATSAGKPYAEIIVDMSGKKLHFARSATDLSTSIPAGSDLVAANDPTFFNSLLPKINAVYAADGTVTSAGGSGIAGLNLQTAPFASPAPAPTPTPPPTPTPGPNPFEGIGNIAFKFAVFAAVMKVGETLFAPPVSGREALSTIRGLDWAKIPSRAISAAFTTLLDSNRDVLAQHGIEIIGDLPSEVKKMIAGASSKHSGNLAVLSDVAGTRLLKKLTKGMSPEEASKVKVTEADIAKEIQSNIEQVIFAYHKGFRTDTYERIVNSAQASAQEKALERADENVNQNLLAASVLTSFGGALTSTGVGAWIGIPMMAMGASKFSHRADHYETDQHISGSNLDKEFEIAKTRVLKKEIDALTNLVITIAKEAKGIEESRKLVHNNKLSTFLFEDISSVNSYSADDIVAKIKQASILAFDGSMRPGSQEYKDAVMYSADIVCSLVKEITGMPVKGAEKYSNINVTASTLASSAVDEKAEVGQPASPQLAAACEGQGLPPMNAPATGQQFMGVMNNAGGDYMLQFAKIITNAMLAAQSGSGPQDVEKVLQTIGSPETTMEEKVKAAGDLIEDNASSSDSQASGDSDDKTTSLTSDEFQKAFEESYQYQRQGLPTLNIADAKIIYNKVIKTFKVIAEDARGKGVIEYKEIDSKQFANLLKQHFNLDNNEDSQFEKLKKQSRDKIRDQLYNLVRSNIISISEENLNKVMSGSIERIMTQNIIVALTKGFIVEALKSSLTKEKPASITQNTTFYYKATNNKLDSVSILEYLNGSSGLKDSSGKLLEPDSNEKRYVYGLINIFNVKLRNESNRHIGKLMSEEIVMGNLSKLLFESPLEAGNVARRKSVDKKVNLRKEWLKIWDI